MRKPVHLVLKVSIDPTHALLLDGLHLDPVMIGLGQTLNAQWTEAISGDIDISKVDNVDEYREELRRGYEHIAGKIDEASDVIQCIRDRLSSWGVKDHHLQNFIIKLYAQNGFGLEFRFKRMLGEFLQGILEGKYNVTHANGYSKADRVANEKTIPVVVEDENKRIKITFYADAENVSSKKNLETVGAINIRPELFIDLDTHHLSWGDISIEIVDKEIADDFLAACGDQIEKCSENDSVYRLKDYSIDNIFAKLQLLQNDYAPKKVPNIAGDGQIIFNRYLTFMLESTSLVELAGIKNMAYLEIEDPTSHLEVELQAKIKNQINQIEWCCQDSLNKGLALQNASTLADLSSIELKSLQEYKNKLYQKELGFTFDVNLAICDGIKAKFLHAKRQRAIELYAGENLHQEKNQQDDSLQCLKKMLELASKEIYNYNLADSGENKNSRKQFQKNLNDRQFYYVYLMHSLIEDLLKNPERKPQDYHAMWQLLGQIERKSRAEGFSKKTAPLEKVLKVAFLQNTDFTNRYKAKFSRTAGVAVQQRVQRSWATRHRYISSGWKFFEGLKSFLVRAAMKLPFSPKIKQSLFANLPQMNLNGLIKNPQEYCISSLADCHRQLLTVRDAEELKRVCDAFETQLQEVTKIKASERRVYFALLDDLEKVHQHRLEAIAKIEESSNMKAIADCLEATSRLINSYGDGRTGGKITDKVKAPVIQNLEDAAKEKCRVIVTCLVQEAKQKIIQLGDGAERNRVLQRYQETIIEFCSDVTWARDIQRQGVNDLAELISEDLTSATISFDEVQTEGPLKKVEDGYIQKIIERKSAENIVELWNEIRDYYNALKEQVLPQNTMLEKILQSELAVVEKLQEKFQEVPSSVTAYRDSLFSLKSSHSSDSSCNSDTESTNSAMDDLTNESITSQAVAVMN